VELGLGLGFGCAPARTLRVHRGHVSWQVGRALCGSMPLL